MRDALLFLTGLVGLPVLVTVGVCVSRLRGAASDLRPGSKHARAVGCVCSCPLNVWGLREALVGSSVVTVGCPVFEHHPEARPGMYKRRG